MKLLKPKKRVGWHSKTPVRKLVLSDEQRRLIQTAMRKANQGGWAVAAEVLAGTKKAKGAMNVVAARAAAIPSKPKREVAPEKPTTGPRRIVVRRPNPLKKAITEFVEKMKKTNTTYPYTAKKPAKKGVYR